MCSSQEGPWCSATPRCTRSSPASRTAWRSTTSLWRAPSLGAFVTFWDNDAGSKIHLLANPGQDVPLHRRGQAGGQPPGVSDAAGQPAVPSQPHEGSLGALPLPLRPRRHLRRHGAQHRHRPRGLPAQGLDGTMTDLFIHLVAYQLVTLSGTGVSVLD